MNQKSIYFVAACMLLLSACKSRNAAEDYTYHEGEWATIASYPLPGNNDKAAAPGRNESAIVSGDGAMVVGRNEVGEGLRVHAGEENEDTHQTPLLWDQDDKLDVFVQANESAQEGYPHSVFELLTGSGTGTGTFRGTMAASGNTYFVMYPSNSAHRVTGNTQGQDPNKISGIVVPGEQAYHDVTFAPGLMPIVGFGDKDGFKVATAGCVLRIPIKSSTAKEIDRVQLSGNQNETIFGTVSYSYQLNGKTLTLTNLGVSGTAGEAMTVTMPNGFTLSETPVYIQFVMPAPVSFGNGFKLTVFGAGDFVRTRVFSGKSVHIDYNKIHTIKPSSGAYDISTWKEPSAL